MPELPEVHTITQDLKKYAEGALIKGILPQNGYQIMQGHAEKHNELQNARIVKVKRISKNIVIETDKDHFVQIHLAMTGRLLLKTAQHPPDKWERVKILLEKNSKEFEIRFSDMRMFGKVQIEHMQNLEKLVNKYGVEPLDEKVQPQEFLNNLVSKKTNIKNVLLDQSIISGLGNVYATDALWMAQIHPETKTTELNLEQATNLLQACREILQEGIKNRGISMSDYVDLLGKKGNQQNHFRVYQKDVCQRCATKTNFIKLNGRGTYFCPNCQK